MAYKYIKHLSYKRSELERCEKMIAETIVDTMNLPKDLMLGASLIHLAGHYEMVIENYKNIILYTEQQVIIQARRTRVKISGEKLEIIYFTGDDMKVKGIFKEITFE